MSQRSLILEDLAKRKSIESIQSCVPDKTLEPVQQLAVVLALQMKRTIIRFDTGLGKTVIAMGLVNLTVSRNEKALFIVKRETLDSIYKKDKSMLNPNLRIGYITNQSRVISRMVDGGVAHTCNLLVISSDCISNSKVNDFLFSVRDNIKTVVIDEMHLFANLESVESRLMNSIAQQSEYCYTLTATPFQRGIDQLINTVFILRKDLFNGHRPRTVYNTFCVYDKGKLVGYKKLDELKKFVKPVTISVSRKMLNINIKHNFKIHWIRPKDEWLRLRGVEAFSAIKSTTDEQPFYKLVEVLYEYTTTGKKGIVYANLNNIKEPVYNELKKLGFKIGIVDGTISIKSQRNETKEKFRNGDLDVLIINTPVSEDLECDFVIFYELTSAYSQLKGRAVRSYKDKEINIDFIITKGTYEEEFYKTHVYEIGKLLEKVCDVDCSELEYE